MRMRRREFMINLLLSVLMTLRDPASPWGSARFVSLRRGEYLLQRHGSSREERFQQPEQLFGMDGLTGESQPLIALQLLHRRGGIPGDQHCLQMSAQDFPQSGYHLRPGLVVAQVIVGYQQVQPRMLGRAQTGLG